MIIYYIISNIVVCVVEKRETPKVSQSGNFFRRNIDVKPSFCVFWLILDPNRLDTASDFSNITTTLP